jgi:hypothetical protein
MGTQFSFPWPHPIFEHLIFTTRKYISTISVMGYSSSRSLTILNISYLLIGVLSMLACRYIYSVLPPGDEDLNGTEVVAIVKFKNALGLDDVDAANMHMEVLSSDLNPAISYCLICSYLLLSSFFAFPKVWPYTCKLQ